MTEAIMPLANSEQTDMVGLGSLLLTTLFLMTFAAMCIGYAIRYMPKNPIMVLRAHLEARRGIREINYHLKGEAAMHQARLNSIEWDKRHEGQSEELEDDILPPQD